MSNLNGQSLFEEWKEVVKGNQMPLENEIQGISISILGKEEYENVMLPSFPLECLMAQKLSVKSPQDLQQQLRRSYEHGQKIIHLDEHTYEQCLKSTEHLQISLQDIPLENTSFYMEVKNDLPQTIQYLHNSMKQIGITLKGVIGTPWNKDKKNEFDYVFQREEIQTKSIRTVILKGNNCISISDELEELFINLHDYISTFQDKYPVHFLLNQIVIQTSLSSSILLEISKLRAIRHLFYHFTQHYEAEDIMPVIYTETKKGTSIYENEDGLFIGASLQAFAAITGGANYLHIDTNNHPKGSHLARNIYHILIEESKINLVKDPFAGSYSIEEMTYKLCKNAWEKFMYRIESTNPIKS